MGQLALDTLKRLESYTRSTVKPPQLPRADGRTTFTVTVSPRSPTFVTGSVIVAVKFGSPKSTLDRVSSFSVGVGDTVAVGEGEASTTNVGVGEADMVADGASLKDGVGEADACCAAEDVGSAEGEGEGVEPSSTGLTVFCGASVCAGVGVVASSRVPEEA